MVRLAAVVMGVVLSASPVYAQDALFTITVPTANIHAAPTTASPIVATAAKGRSFAVARELGSWVAIASPADANGVAYVHLSWGRFSRDAAVEGGAPTSAPSPVASSTESRIDRQPDASTDRQPGVLTSQSGSRVEPAARVQLPSHLVGVGGRLGLQALSRFAVNGRVWFAGPVGVQLELGRSARTSPAALRLNVTGIGFSAITSFADVTDNAMWVRPYAGGGLTLFRSSLQSPSGATMATDSSRGYQVFGGAEFTSASLPQVAVSADVRRVWRTAAFSGSDEGGFGVGLAAHWYIK